MEQVKAVVDLAIKMCDMLGVSPSAVAKELAKRDTNIPLLDNLSNRSVNLLSIIGVTHLQDLTQCTAVDILKIPGAGKKTLKEVEELLARHNLHLKQG